MLTGDAREARVAEQTAAVSSAAAPADPFSAGQAVPDAGDQRARFDGSAWVEAPRPVPGGGWRRAVHRLTRGRVNPGPDAHELRVRSWVEEIRRPFAGARTVAVVSTKGGVGKTTTTVGLGHTLASVRGDRVVALDANPDAGSLGHRFPARAPASADDLLRQADELRGYGDVRRFTARAASSLEVVACPDDPRLTRRLGRAEYQRLLEVLHVHYNLVLADCGTGILDAATRGVVQGCDQLVVVTGPSVDAARAVSYLLEWLRAHGFGGLVDEAVVVVNGVRPGRRPVDLKALMAHFEAEVRTVLDVPFDEELANGGAVELEWLATATRQAYLRLAAAVVDGMTPDTIDLLRTGEMA